MYDEESARRRMQELIETLNYHTKLYDEGKPVISDTEWDSMYFELQELEMLFNIHLPNSPTSNVIFEVKNELKKVHHNHDMLSLGKTKDMAEVYDFLGSKDFITMLKMDGLTCSLCYKDGVLVSAETRGDGYIGEDVLHNVLTIDNVPKRINYKDELIIDGEIICTYQDFEKFKDEYQNPRNFAAGSIRLLDSKECAKRKLTFVAWDVIKGFDNLKYLNQKFQEIGKLNFTVVPWLMGDDFDAKEFLVNEAKKLGYPIDGLVFKFDDIAYGESLGQTEHHKRNAIAFKFEDEVYETRLQTIEWTIGRTGVLTPVAIFNPVEIDFTIVERASLHNVSVLRDTLGDCAYRGEPLKVYKANQIIPQIYPVEEEYRHDYGYIVSHGGVSANDNPEFCPYCGHEIDYITSPDGIIIAKCSNDNCIGKKVYKFDHFCGKKGLDIKHISENIIEDFIDEGYLNTLGDVFTLKDHRKELINMEGYGAKSIDRILTMIDEAKNTTLDKFISALGIDLIGSSVSKDLCKIFKTYDDFKSACVNGYKFEELENFGEAKANSLRNYNFDEADGIYKYLNVSNPLFKTNEEKPLDGVTVVITGSLGIFKNRDKMKEMIEKYGGKVAGSVSKNTTVLVNNDINSTTGKNKRAKELNIPIMSEPDFIKQYLEDYLEI